MVLTYDHHFHSAGVFSPSGGRILTNFPSVPVSADGSIENGFVVLGEFRFEPEAGDGPSTNQTFFQPFFRFMSSSVIE